MNTATCHMCGQTKFAEYFSKDKNRKNNLRKHCKECRNYEMAQRMFVDGKYISIYHPLYKPGRYKTLADAWSHKEIERVDHGHVYIISNPAWESWYKVGKAVDAEDRLRGYQTSSPMRDYELLYSKKFGNRHKAEKEVHNRLISLDVDSQGEWFYTNYSVITKAIEDVHAKHSAGYRNKPSPQQDMAVSN